MTLRLNKKFEFLRKSNNQMFSYKKKKKIYVPFIWRFLSWEYFGLTKFEPLLEKN